MALDVTFTDEIPKIAREGFTRSSKYNKILDACVERSPKAARITVESQGQASSRASSIKDASEKHPAAQDNQGHFVVATRSGDADNEYNVFVKYVEGPEPESEKPQAKKTAKKVAKKQSTA